MAEDQYLKCKDCGHENFVDPNCEVPPSEYTCDECGKELRGQA
jgi:DNA-directed RNA polymerase subunit RPC12/RpoP